MSLSMYQASGPVFIRALENLSAILKKGEASAQARSIDPSVFINSRLAPDMLPLARQIHIATDGVKGAAARLTGTEIPSYTDDETTFEELQARIAKTVAFLKTVPEAGFEGSDTRPVILKLRNGEREFTGASYLQGFVIPNLYFHVTAAYLILRHNGVDLGKPDFLGGA